MMRVISAVTTSVIINFIITLVVTALIYCTDHSHHYQPVL